MSASLEDTLKQIEVRSEFATLKAALLQNNPRLHAILKEEEYTSLEELAECYDLDIQSYTIVRKAGDGGFGLVYKALHADGQRAIKILAWPKRGVNPKVDYAHTIFGEEGIEQNERIADAFRHEHIVRYYERGTLTDGTSYLVFEWINGENLEKKGKLTPKEFATYMPQLLKAIAHIHTQGYLHNDIRRPNIMIDKPNGRERVTLLDYSIASPHRNGVSARQASLASREVFAPEALHGAVFSAQTDIWVLGNLMYQTLTGEHPFPYDDKEQLLKIIENPSSYVALKQRISRNIPKQYRAIIERCLAYYSQERYASVDEIIAEFSPPQGTYWKLPTTIAFVGAIFAGVWMSQLEEIPEKETARVVKEAPKTGWQYPHRIQDGEDKYASCVSLDEPAKRSSCMNFRDAEELLDKREYERAAFVLEDILAIDQSDYRYYAALLHAYYEMGRITEASDVLQELQIRFPKEKHIGEVAVYAPEIRAQLVQSGPGFREFTAKQCDISFIAEKYPECRALVAAVGLEGNDAITTYGKIVAEYPESALAHHALGALLMKKGEKKTLPGGKIVYDHIDIMNEGLAHYKYAAELTGNPDGIFREIGEIFRDHYHDHTFTFLFLYNGKLHKNTDAVEGDIAVELISMTETGCSLESEGYICEHPTPQQQYKLLAQHCMENIWRIKNCTHT